ncbi:uncharacterized protein LACBIDRAFT_309496 [Laccaria bicolor S238N-H82]|uniref:Predicted protein n=1 Tax=Laccaria bicolor (strain S238N-H82 / ATCC MYA-4686) TaxID=486041 RepID=B0DSG1_LACBS|nr:uncharacterized protein LACBIDRAFT_309496 [Laccaria bicolor S238N-H82]EDR02469.1 predicted protein [Laccaria bicolor S238N-H82]|eukprot:XP_001886832.1 predicted protein [Laccaria bicolor S238N-H82]
MSTNLPSEDGRPPGGTARTPGNRTPRKVQWIDESREEEPVVEATGSSHLLDERALDPTGFHKLTEALEKHRKATTPLTHVHYYPPTPLSDSFTRDDIRPGGLYASSSAPSSVITFDSSPLTQPPSPTHHVPNNFIDPLEDAGLPGTKSLQNFSRRKAAKLAKVYKHPSHLWRSITTDHSEKDNRKGEEGWDRDVESEASHSSDGGGMLSTLLSLFSEKPSKPRKLHSRTSSTEQLRTWTSGSDLSDQEYFRTRPESTSEPVGGKFADEVRRKSHVPRPHLSLPSLGIVSRPKAARSDGGVIGSLIASTGNIAGAAAPVASTLQPDVDKPGFRLSRYSTKPVEVPTQAKTLRRQSSLMSIQRPPSVLGASPSLTPSPPASAPPSLYRAGNRHSMGFRKDFTFPSMTSLKSSLLSGRNTPLGSPTTDEEGGTAPERKKRRHKRKKAEVFITRHLAHVIQREEFLLKLTRAMMMFGGPVHRLQSQIQSAGRVLDVELSLLYLPDVALISFNDSSTGTSHIKLIRQGSALDIGKLTDAFHLYWQVIHDKLSVSNASIDLDNLMQKPPMYKWWHVIFIGGMCSAAICSVSFSGSFLDCLISFPLGAFLVFVQIMSVRNVLYTYVFEFTMTTLFSFLAAALAATHHFCYSAVASASVVLILPGFIVLTGSLELLSRNIISGSVRLCYSIIYALILGFGFAIGAECYVIFTGSKIYGSGDQVCSVVHNSPHWYQKTPSKFWAFLTVPLYSLFLSMRNQAPLNRKEMPLLVGISSVGWVTNYFTGTKFVGQSDVVAGVGAFAVGIVANLYARIFDGNAFVVMITGILFQLPSGLGSGGLLVFATETAEGSQTSSIDGFSVALRLISVAIGLAVGLGLASAVAFPIQSKKREGGIFSL